MKRSFLFIVFILVSIISRGSSLADTVELTFDEFIQLVKTNHPISQQADMVVESGQANLLKARGSFDPVLKSEYNQKQFNDKNYYQLNTNELKIPTPLGLELKAGYDNNQGSFVNPENQNPENGLAYAGIAIPLGSGLLFDERRNTVRQAEVFQRSTVLEQMLMINQLVFDAAKAYWNWQASWNTYEIYNESVSLAEFRFRGVKQSFQQGDVPAIDTLEAFILLQNRQLSLNEAMIRLNQARLDASNFLWSEDQQPLLLNETSMPQKHDERDPVYPMNIDWLDAALENIEQTHPKIKYYYNKLEMLDYDRRMKVEKIKPKLNINYNVLNQPVGNNPFENYSANDYKWGFEFSMPLLLRKGRGDLQLAKLKISQADLDRENETLKIKNKIKSYQIEIENLFQQINLYQATVENYLSLLRGEQRKFEEGESSLFLVNSRENSLINAEIKLIELYAKYQKAKAGLQYAMGGATEDV